MESVKSSVLKSCLSVNISGMLSAGSNRHNQEWFAPEIWHLQRPAVHGSSFSFAAQSTK